MCPHPRSHQLTWYRTLEETPMKRPQVSAVMPSGGMHTSPSQWPDTLRLRIHARARQQPTGLHMCDQGPGGELAPVT